MSRGELWAGVRAAAVYLSNPPGWIPAWATLAFVMALGWGIQTAALATDVDLQRLAAAQSAYNVTVEMYKVTLATWLGYRGLGSIVEAIGAVRELRRASQPPTA